MTPPPQSSERDQRHLVRRLSKAHAFSTLPRVLRLARKPWRMLYPWTMLHSGQTREVHARTFWGASLKVVLPEAVSTSIWRYGYFEEDVCLFLLEVLEPGMTFIDVGAHFGFFTLLGSYLVGSSGKVFAIEPHPDTHRILRANIEHRNGIEVFNCAAFDADAEAELIDYGPQRTGLSSLFGYRDTTAAPKNASRIVVQTRRIDSLRAASQWERTDLVKIDAESSEACVLAGMEEILREHRPKLILEVGDFEIQGVPSSEEIVRSLEALGYRAFETHRGRILPHRRRRKYAYGNLLFVPK